MTIGIGVLCSTHPKPYVPRPDSIILIADTMGSTDTDSIDDLHKMWLNDDLKLYAAGADILEYSGELFLMIEDHVREIDKAGEPRTHGRISAALNKAVHLHRAQHFQWDVVPNLAIPGLPPLTDTSKLLEEWQKFAVNAQMLIATVMDDGQAYLYLIGYSLDVNGNVAPKMVHLFEFPGYATIGSGSGNANFWLNYRHQVLGLSVKQSVYHAYEAKQMAAKSPTVNDAIEIGLIMPGQKSFHLSAETPTIEGCPVSLPELEEMFKNHGPQETNSLGHSKNQPLASRRLKGRR